MYVVDGGVTTVISVLHLQDGNEHARVRVSYDAPPTLKKTGLLDIATRLTRRLDAAAV